jgi:hypothetical protein
MFAASTSKKSVIKYLITQGADSEAKNNETHKLFNNGKSAHDYANTDEIKHILLKK